MPIVKCSKIENNKFAKYKSTYEADLLFSPIANTDGAISYHQYSDVLFTTKFLDAYNYTNKNVVIENNICEFDSDGYLLLNHIFPISNIFTIVISVYFYNITKQSILFSNNNNFQISLNPIGYNNCVVLKLGNNVCFQKDVVKQNSWNNIVFRCDGQVIQSFINRNIKKQPIENFELINNVFSIGCNYNQNYFSKFLSGKIKQLSLYSVYKSDNFIINY